MVPWWMGWVELRRVRRPLWRVTMPAEIQRPRPVPLRSLVVKKGSKMRARTAGVMPWPVSAMVMRTPRTPGGGCRRSRGGDVVGADEEAAAALAHGVDGVGDEVVEDLADVVFEAEDGWWRWRRWLRRGCWSW